MKGYLTDTALPPAEAIDSYGQLWHVEKAFRISKTDLPIRPMYPYRRRRTEFHALITFVAYTIFEELEHRRDEAELLSSPKRTVELTQTMYEIFFNLPNDPQEQRALLKMAPEPQVLYDLPH